MFIKNTWYVAGWSKEVPQDGFLARTLLGIPVALWRDLHSFPTRRSSDSDRKSVV